MGLPLEYLYIMIMVMIMLGKEIFFFLNDIEKSTTLAYSLV